MKITSTAFGLFTLLAGCSAVPVAPPLPSPLPRATPEAVGLSTERLLQVDDFIERMQREHKVAGAVTLIARHGKLVSLTAHGFADLESQRAMRVDDLFHLQSMTKPIATVAALQLIERGRLQLSDPSRSICLRSRRCRLRLNALTQRVALCWSRPHGRSPCST